ncbi:MAG: PD-(D/E)XK nuclease family protein, partial [Daejeonella sp.]
FQLKNIPVNAKRKVNILKEPFGIKLINILRYVDKENENSYSGDDLLFEIMHYDFYDINPIDIAKISVEVNEHNKQHNDKDKISLRSKICDVAQKTGTTLFDSESYKQLKRLSGDLEFWIKEAVNLTLQGLFEKIMIGAEGGILGYILRSPDSKWLMEVISSFFNFLKEESRKKPDLKLREFVILLDLLKDNSLPLELNQNVFNEEGVNFLTCHGSKGLEFEYVYLIGCTKNVWEKKRKMNSGYKMPDTMFTSMPSANEEEELRRLFYVALTRAKKHLYISYTLEDTKGKALESTVFIGEILAATDMEINNQTLSEQVLTDFFKLQFTQSERPNIGLVDKEYINHLLENYALSITHLNNYLECPLKFYFQNLIQVPSSKSDYLTFGNAAHHALNKLFRSLTDNNNQFHSLKHFVDDFNWYMRRNREAFTIEQFNRRMEYGEKILPDYYNKYINGWEKVTVTEYAIKNLEVDYVPVQGRLDKIEFKGTDVNVVDYKTGSYETAKPKFKRPDDKIPNGGDYWRQAVYYKLLVDNDRRKDWRVISTEFDFLEPEKGEYIKEKVVITPEDLSIVKAQIKDTYTRIKNHEFTTGCGREECTWCNFVRSNFRQTKDLLKETAEEERQ